MSKKSQQQKLQQQKKATKDGQREREKFFAWLGEILSTGMSQQDFEKAQLLYKQGISTAQMKSTLEKRVTRT